ncbi:MAG: hypothetical protein ABEK16_02370 [Candidatus Nanohalobium sp.]
MSHSSGNSKHAPDNRERMLANLVASTIIGGFRILISIFSAVFRMLASLV